MSLKKQFLNKILTLFLVGGLVFASFLTPTANAVGVLPSGTGSYSADECFTIVDAWTEKYSESGYAGMPTTLNSVTSTQMLACALKSGNMSFWMVPYFVNYALEFVINVAGILVVLMIVIGGYYYIYGAVTEDKDKGKTIITYAIGGYALVLISWFIVNALLLAVTQ